MKLIELIPNAPQTFALDGEISPVALPSGSGWLYPLSDGRWMHLSSPVAQSLADLKLTPGESFRVCIHQKGMGLPYWSVWLSPDTEKARAAAEAPELERQLAASLEVVGRRKGSQGTSAPVLAPTGTEGPTLMPAQSPARRPAIAAMAGARQEKPGPIPANVAFSEILDFTGTQLKAKGLTWNDQAVQDFISTVWISGCKAGWITLWERQAA